MLTAMIALLLLALAPGRPAASGAQEAAAQSPSGATLAVIAQGVAALPTDPVAWRLVADTAEPVGEAAFEERALGFALAIDAPILLTDEGTGEQALLARGEAAFVPEAIRQQRESLGDGATTYLRIGLVPPPDAFFTNGDQLLFAGDSFAALPGRRDLDLVRGVLDPDRATQLPDTGAPTLVVAIAGRVTVAVDGGPAVTLNQFETAALPGPLTIAAGSEGALFVAAVIGPAVPEASAPIAPVAPDEPVSPDAAEVWVFLRGCPAEGPPAGAAYAAFDATCGDPLAGTTFVLNAGGAELVQQTVVDIAAPGQSLAVWTSVPPGPVSIGGENPPGYQGLAVFCRYVGDPNPPQPIQNPGFSLAAGDVLHCHYFTWPSGQEEPAPATGAIYLQLLGCPPGVTPADLPQRQDECTVGFDGPELYLNGDALTGPLTLADATPTQNAVGWSGLPLGAFTLGFAPPGTAYVASASDADALGAPASNNATSYPVTLSAANPEVVLQVYALSFAPPAEPATGSITIEVLLCPEGMTAQVYDPAGCAPAAPGVGVPFVRAVPSGDELPVTALDQAGRYESAALPLGAYFVGLDDIAIYTIAGLPGDSIQGGFPPFILDADSPDLMVTIYGFPHFG